ncbi:PEP-CTERM sorting domain-containing protein [Photobacterium makurazakiensis]|uniref:PEP-CTERM sorting domain-containing protein n=1 Tax=Photobacterium makurazakiensis TaxID=2910234 RepID=UPI003D1429A9
MRQRITIMVFIASIFTSATQAAILSVTQANMSSVGGSAQLLVTAPVSVEDDAPENENTAQQGFNERQNVLLTSALQTDDLLIAAGTRVDSHMIFLNSDRRQRIKHNNVYWTFSGTILGVMSDRHGTLEAASNYLGHPDTIYPGSFRNRGLEGRNSYEINDNVLTVNMRVREPGDWIRVITDVPEPAMLGLFGLALLGLTVRRRKPVNAPLGLRRKG